MAAPFVAIISGSRLNFSAADDKLLVNHWGLLHGLICCLNSFLWLSIMSLERTIGENSDLCDILLSLIEIVIKRIDKVINFMIFRITVNFVYFVEICLCKIHWFVLFSFRISSPILQRFWHFNWILIFHFLYFFSQIQIGNFTIFGLFENGREILLNWGSNTFNFDL